MSLETALQRIVEDGPNPTEFLLIGSPNWDEKEFDTGIYLESWATAFSHRLRDKEQRNPVSRIDGTEVKAFIQARLERDIVFNANGIHADEAQLLAAEIAESIAVVQAATISFPINDWTFSDVLVAQGEKLVCVLAFLGED